MSQRPGHHFVQIPGPSPIPERVLRAMDKQVIDHRGPEFQRLGLAVLGGCRAIFKTSGPVVIYPSSGTGAWEAAIVNTLSPGDKVLMVAARAGAGPRSPPARSPGGSGGSGPVSGGGGWG